MLSSSRKLRADTLIPAKGLVTILSDCITMVPELNDFRER